MGSGLSKADTALGRNSCRDENNVFGESPCECSLSDGGRGSLAGKMAARSGGMRFVERKRSIRSDAGEKGHLVIREEVNQNHIDETLFTGSTSDAWRKGGEPTGV